MNKIKSLTKKSGLALGLAALLVVFAMAVPTFAAASSAQSGVTGLAEQTGTQTDLMSMIALILNLVYTVIGVVAVVMIIIGGVNYATSQGDSTKVKKAKDTILYGIIGLVIVLLAFAITNFVLSGLTTTPATGGGTPPDPATPTP